MVRISSLRLHHNSNNARHHHNRSLNRDNNNKKQTLPLQASTKSLVSSAKSSSFSDSRSFQTSSHRYFATIRAKNHNARFQSQPSDVQLYSYWRSSCPWRVRIVLAFKEINYEYKAVNLLKGEQNSSEYTDVNPLKNIPTLIIDGRTLGQSLAIMEYLEETRPTPALLPTDHYQRALARQITNIIACDIQPLQNLKIVTEIAKLGGDEKKKEWANTHITNGLNAVEKIVAKSHGKYCIGDQVSFADVCIIPQLAAARRFGVNVDQFPTLLKIEAELLQLKSFQDADQNAQPDAQK